MRLALALERVLAVHVTGLWDGLQAETYDELDGRMRLTVFADRELSSGSTPVPRHPVPVPRQ